MTRSADTVVMTAAEVRAAQVRDQRSDALIAWRHLGQLLGSRKNATCGIPLGRARHEPRGGVWRSAHVAASCGRPECPRCGLEIGLRRWAMLTLAIARHVADGGYIIFLSVSGQHWPEEAVSVVADRLRWLTKLVPGSASTIGQRFLRERGVEAWARVIEPTFGGQNGVNPNAHWVLFARPLPGEDQRDTAAQFAPDLQRTIGTWLARRRLRLGSEVDAELRIWTRFTGDQAFDSRVGGVGAAAYVTKLADGQGIAGLASELTDPTGSKHGVRNVGGRALPYWLAYRARHQLGGSTRTVGRVLRRDAVAMDVITQWVQWKSATRGVKLWSTSAKLLADWADMETVDLVHAASRVASADKEASASAFEQLGRLVTVEEETAGGPFDLEEEPLAEESIPLDDPDWWRPVVIDANLEGHWAHESDETQWIGGIDGAVNRLLDRRGAWGAIATIGLSAGEAACQVHEHPGTGELLLVWRRDDDPIPRGYEAVPWRDVWRRVRDAPVRSRPNRIAA